MPCSRQMPIESWCERGNRAAWPGCQTVRRGGLFGQLAFEVQGTPVCICQCNLACCAPWASAHQVQGRT